MRFLFAGAMAGIMGLTAGFGIAVAADGDECEQGDTDDERDCDTDKKGQSEPEPPHEAQRSIHHSLSEAGVSDQELENLFEDNLSDRDIQILLGEEPDVGSDEEEGPVIQRGNAGGGGEGYGRVGGLGEVETGTDIDDAVISVDFEALETSEYCESGEVSTILNARSDSFKHCYEREWRRDSELGGEVTYVWRIELDGSVSNLFVNESSLDHSSTEDCVHRVIERMFFPEPDGGMCDVEFSMEFSEGSDESDEE